MYRVVLIDDEQIIIKGLSTVVKWADFGCTVAGTAYSAEEGIELIRNVRPHILFTDIRMPGQNGLNMLAAVLKEFPDMQVCVLTGYRDFSYAQEAIRLGVTRFLLKPSKMDEITEALTVMTAKLDKLHPEEEVQTNQPAAGFLVNQAIAFMEQEYHSKLTLQDVANHCYVSQWHLSKLLNRQTGKSFYDLLNSIRIEKAKELLQNPGLKIGDIVELVGFSDSAHFARVFKKVVGLSANEYRNRL